MSVISSVNYTNACLFRDNIPEKSSHSCSSEKGITRTHTISDSFTYNKKSNEENENFNLFTYLFHKKPTTVKDIMDTIKKDTDSTAKPIEHLSDFSTPNSIKTSISTKNGYTIVSLPKSLESNTISNTPIVVTLDNFKLRNINIGAEVNVSHGELTAKYATSGLENGTELLSFDITDENGIIREKPYSVALDKVIELKKAGANIKFLNLSIGGSIGNNPFGLSCKTLSRELGVDFDENNVMKNKDLIVEKLKERVDKYIKERDKIREEFNMPTACDPFEETYLHAYETISKINTLVDMGVEVFLGAGNDGKGMMSSEALSNAHCVGAKNGKKLENYSSESSLVTDYAQGRYIMKPVYQNGEYIGITDGKITFKKEEIGNWIYKEPDMKLISQKDTEYQKILDDFFKDFTNNLTEKEYKQKIDNLISKVQKEDEICPDTLINKNSIMIRYLKSHHSSACTQTLEQIKAGFNEYYEEDKDKIGEIKRKTKISNIIKGTSFATPTKLNEYLSAVT